MDKYIKLEPLLKELEENTPYNWSDEDYEQGEANGYKYAVSIVEAQDTADVAEVKHGHWIRTGAYVCGEYEFKCSVCKNKNWHTSDANAKYCQYCGARMDGEGE